MPPPPMALSFTPVSDEPEPLVTTDAPIVLRVDGVQKAFRRAGGDLVRAVDDVTLDVRAGEVLVLLGPSGCGKTTLLRCIAGLEHPDAGRIEIHGDDVFDASARVKVSPQRRRLSMIFQSYALFPHMTAFENVAYPLRSRKAPKAGIEAKVVDALGMVGIADLREQHPAQMSGGQQQRVALARALVANDNLVLFDEPLSNVDARVREQLRFELAEMQAALGFAAVYVTHDQIEALSLAHRVAVMGDGAVQQLGTPRDIYEHPASRYVANFIGTTNELPGLVVEVAGGDLVVDTAVGRLRAVAPEDVAVGIGDAVVLTCRPERCSLAGPIDAENGANVLMVTVQASLFVGAHTEVLVRAVEDDQTELKVWTTDQRTFASGQQLHLAVPPSALRALRDH